MTTPDITTRLRESELLPCPFCGGEASDTGNIRFSRPLDDTTWADGSAVTEAFSVNCVSCGAVSRTGVVGGYQTKAEAVSAWNRRVPAWQPIETAPKDGTPFLVYLPQATWDVGLKPTVTVMFWAAWENFASLYADRIGESEGDAGDWIPTHWMPLPTPPSQIEEGKDGHA